MYGTLAQRYGQQHYGSNKFAEVVFYGSAFNDSSWFFCSQNFRLCTGTRRVSPLHICTIQCVLVFLDLVFFPVSISLCALSHLVQFIGWTVQHTYVRSPDQYRQQWSGQKLDDSEHTFDGLCNIIARIINAKRKETKTTINDNDDDDADQTAINQNLTLRVSACLNDRIILLFIQFNLMICTLSFNYVYNVHT